MTLLKEFKWQERSLTKTKAGKVQIYKSDTLVQANVLQKSRNCKSKAMSHKQSLHQGIR
jgi:hypothetical protein